MCCCVVFAAASKIFLAPNPNQPKPTQTNPTQTKPNQTTNQRTTQNKTQGDLSYAQGYAADWDRFGEMFERSRVFTARPLLTASGNHETDWPGAPDVDPFGGLSRDSGGECGVPLAKRYVTPARPSASAADSGGGGGGPRPSGSTSDPSNMRRRFYYSADVGAVHFLVLDSEAPTGVGSPQRAFVESDLATVDRSVTPWVVVG